MKSGLVVKWVSAEEDGEHLAGLECAGLRRNVYFFQFGLFFFVDIFRKLYVQIALVGSRPINTEQATCKVFVG